MPSRHWPQSGRGPETCVRLLKRHAAGEPDALSRGELAYTAAKAEVDAVLAGAARGAGPGGHAVQPDRP